MEAAIVAYYEPSELTLLAAALQSSFALGTSGT